MWYLLPLYCDSYPHCVHVKLDTLLKEFDLFNTAVLEVLEQHKSSSFTKTNGSQMGFIVYVCRRDVLNCRFNDKLLSLHVELEPIIGQLGWILAVLQFYQYWLTCLLINNKTCQDRNATDFCWLFKNRFYYKTYKSWVSQSQFMVMVKKTSPFKKCFFFCFLVFFLLCLGVKYKHWQKVII